MKVIVSLSAPFDIDTIVEGTKRLFDLNEEAATKLSYNLQHASTTSLEVPNIRALLSFVKSASAETLEATRKTASFKKMKATLLDNLTNAFRNGSLEHLDKSIVFKIPAVKTNVSNTLANKLNSLAGARVFKPSKGGAVFDYLKGCPFEVISDSNKFIVDTKYGNKQTMTEYKLKSFIDSQVRLAMNADSALYEIEESYYASKLSIGTQSYADKIIFHIGLKQNRVKMIFNHYLTVNVTGKIDLSLNGKTFKNKSSYDFVKAIDKMLEQVM